MKASVRPFRRKISILNITGGNIMVVQHNMTAYNANRYLGINNNNLSKSLEKLSSGYQINRAGDNAAGLAVSEKMRSQIAGITQATANAQDGISMVQTFEGALTETHNILQRMKTLATQSANGTYDDATDRAAIELEYEQLARELNDISSTDFNGTGVLAGASGISVGDAMSASEMYNSAMSGTSGLQLVSYISLQVGARTKDLKKYTFNYSSVFNSMKQNAATGKTADIQSAIGTELKADLNVSATGLGLVTSKVNLASQKSANQAIDKIDHAINKVSLIRATFGSIQNRLEHKIDNLNVTNENLTSAESRIRDTNMAAEMMKFTKNQILSQAAQSMLSQANQIPQGALSLLQ
jgi:flagellin